MSKKAVNQPVKGQDAAAKKSTFVRDSRGFIVKLPKPNMTQLIKKGL